MAGIGLRGPGRQRAAFGLLAVLLAVPTAGVPAMGQDKKPESGGAEVWTGAAQACFEAPAPEDGVVACSKAIKTGGLSARTLAITYSNRGNSFYDLGQLDRAITDYTTALSLIPDDPVTYSNRAAAYTDQGSYESALADLDKAVALDRTNATVWGNRCWVRAILEQFEEAIADCGQALRLAPTDPMVLASRAYARLASGDPKSALDDANEAVRYGDGVWQTHFYRGLIHNALGHEAAAREDLTLAHGLGAGEPRITETMKALGFAVPSQ